MFHHVFLPVFSARRHPRIRVLKVRKSWSSACACCPPRVCACNLFVCAATDTAPSASGRAPDQPLGRCADMILTHCMCRAADQAIGRRKVLMTRDPRAPGPNRADLVGLQGRPGPLGAVNPCRGCRRNPCGCRGLLVFLFLFLYGRNPSQALHIVRGIIFS